MKKLLITSIVLLAVGVFVGAIAFASTGLLPDLQTVVPQHIQLVNEHHREIIRFSNAIANTGAGPWRMRAFLPLTDVNQAQDAVQEILDASGNLVEEKVVSQFQFHPTHNHWHINGVALFEVRSGSPTGPVFGSNSIKTTFCLIDWYKLDDNSPTKERVYFDCNGAYQGISSGWADQYHQAIDGQQLDITGAPEGVYYLVSTTNHERVFIESNYTNDTAWVAFELRRDSNGNPKIKIVDHSPCAGGLCGENAPNR